MTREEAINLIGWLKSKTNRDDDLPNCGADMRPKLVGKHADVTIIDEACMKGADDETD